MATFDLFDSIHHEPARRLPARTSVFAPFVEAWRTFRRRIEEHRVLVSLSRKNPRLLRDMGFEPDEIYDTVRNTWDEVPPARRRNAVDL
jgi:uncharacterized protein YjiS (DUF1127 family)